MYTIKTFKTLNVKFNCDTASRDQIKNCGVLLHYFIRMKLNGTLEKHFYTNEQGITFDLRCIVLEVINILLIFY